MNPLAHWTFEECWNYLRKYDVPYHPLHDVGFSSLGDVQSTKKARSRRDHAELSMKAAREIYAEIKSRGAEMPPRCRRDRPRLTEVGCAQVPHEKWYQYAGERSGRFEGMKAKDGSAKSECGIHSFDANAK